MQSVAHMFTFVCGQPQHTCLQKRTRSSCDRLFRMALAGNPYRLDSWRAEVEPQAARTLVCDVGVLDPVLCCIGHQMLRPQMPDAAELRVQSCSNT